MLGTQVNWAGVHPPHSFALVRLPHHPFRRTRLWITCPADWFERHTAIEERTPEMADSVDTRPTDAGVTDLAAASAEIAGWVAELLGMGAGEVDPRRTLLKLGADSLVFVELVCRVDATYKS